ncbi:MAG: right-handed parallel beta-helix repeat-containing protein [Candidatus Zixiibacteriota bacterium]|nr:MAG: right-handed parallel beta-helix repeat-containing protein [candidate division Zixibacteria bacterium]
MKANALGKTMVGGVLLLLIAGFVGVDVARATTIYADHNGFCGGNTPCYTTIGLALDAASSGDTVYVYNGTYSENVVVEESIHLIGQNREQTIIDGGGSDDVVHVSADSVSIKRFTIRNSGTTWMEGYWDSGIELDYSDNSEVRYCIFHDNTAGLGLFGSSYSTISDCRFWSNTAGIVFSEDEMGPHEDNFRNKIFSNTIEYNSERGIYFEHTTFAYHHANVVRGNNISYNGIGVYMIMSHENDVSCNRISNNTGYGISIATCTGGGQYNRLHRNNFTANNGGGVQGYDFSGGISTNYWNSQTCEEGNYWSDYTGPDTNGDGIGDIPYDIDGEESQDLYPLMAPFICGDANQDGEVTIGDVVYLIGYLYRGGPSPDPVSLGDPNGDATIDVGDVVYLINYLFRAGPPPGCAW